PNSVHAELPSYRSSEAVRPIAASDSQVSAIPLAEDRDPTNVADGGPTVSAQACTSSEPGVCANKATTCSRTGSYVTEPATTGRGDAKSSCVHGPVSSTSRIHTVESANR